MDAEAGITGEIAVKALPGRQTSVASVPEAFAAKPPCCHLAASEGWQRRSLGPAREQAQLGPGGFFSLFMSRDASQEDIPILIASIAARHFRAFP